MASHSITGWCEDWAGPFMDKYLVVVWGAQCGYRRCKSKVLCHVEKSKMQGLRTCCGSKKVPMIIFLVGWHHWYVKEKKYQNSRGAHFVWHRDYPAIQWGDYGQILNWRWLWKLACLAGSFIYVVAKPHRVWRGVCLPFAASFALQFCWSIRKPTRYPCWRMLLWIKGCQKYLWRLALKASLFITIIPDGQRLKCSKTFQRFQAVKDMDMMITVVYSCNSCIQDFVVVWTEEFFAEA